MSFLSATDSVARQDPYSDKPNSDENAACAVRYTVTALAHPGVLGRVLEPFALRNLVPRRVVSTAEADGMRIDVVADGLGARESEHLCLRLRQIVPVQTVLLSPVEDA